MVEAGVDEAGRGPVIGPMVIAVVSWRNEDAAKVGVKDSKKLTPESRRRLYSIIAKNAHCVKYRVIEPGTIDEYAVKGMLNRLEAITISGLLKECPAEVAYIDSPDPNPERFRIMIGDVGIKLIVMNHADESIPVVSAASIVAKVVRDSIIDELKAIYGDFGSGYPSDPRTISMLREWIESGSVPPIVRRSWATFRRLLNSRLM